MVDRRIILAPLLLMCFIWTGNAQETNVTETVSGLNTEVDLVTDNVTEIVTILTEDENVTATDPSVFGTELFTDIVTELDTEELGTDIITDFEGDTELVTVTEVVTELEDDVTELVTDYDIITDFETDIGTVDDDELGTDIITDFEEDTELATVTELVTEAATELEDDVTELVTDYDIVTDFETDIGTVEDEDLGTNIITDFEEDTELATVTELVTEAATELEDDVTELVTDYDIATDFETDIGTIEDDEFTAVTDIFSEEATLDDFTEIVTIASEQVTEILISDGTEIITDFTLEPEDFTEITEIETEQNELFTDATKIATDVTEEEFTDKTELVTDLTIGTDQFSKVTEIETERTEVVSDVTDIVTDVTEETEIVTDFTEEPDEFTGVTEIETDRTELVSDATDITEETEIVTEFTEEPDEFTDVTEFETDQTELFTDLTDFVTDVTKEKVTGEEELVTDFTVGTDELTDVTELETEQTEVVTDVTEEEFTEETDKFTDSSTEPDDFTDVGTDRNEFLSDSTDGLTEVRDVTETESTDEGTYENITELISTQPASTPATSTATTATVTSATTTPTETTTTPTVSTSMTTTAPTSLTATLTVTNTTTTTTATTALTVTHTLATSSTTISPATATVITETPTSTTSMGTTSMASTTPVTGPDTVNIAGSTEITTRDGAQLSFTDSLQDPTSAEYMQLETELQNGLLTRLRQTSANPDAILGVQIVGFRPGTSGVIALYNVILDPISNMSDEDLTNALTTSLDGGTNFAGGGAVYSVIPSSIFFQPLLVISGSIRILQRNGVIATFTSDLLNTSSAAYTEYSQDFIEILFFNIKQRNVMVQSVVVTSLTNGSIITGFNYVAYRGPGANAPQLEVDLRASVVNTSFLVFGNRSLLLDLGSIVLSDPVIITTTQPDVPTTAILISNPASNLGLIIGLATGAFLLLLLLLILCGCLMVVSRDPRFQKRLSPTAFVETQDPVLYPEITAIRPGVIRNTDISLTSESSEHESSDLFDSDSDDRIDHVMRILEQRQNTLRRYIPQAHVNPGFIQVNHDGSEFSIPYMATGEEAASYNQRHQQSSTSQRITHRSSSSSQDDEGIRYGAPERVFTFNSQDMNRMAHLARVLQNAGRMRGLPYAHAPPRSSSIYGTEEDTMTTSDHFSLPYVATGEESAIFNRGAVSPPSYHSRPESSNRSSLHGHTNQAQMPFETWF